MGHGAYGRTTGELSETDRAVLAEARELTRQMLEADEEESAADEAGPTADEE